MNNLDPHTLSSAIESLGAKGLVGTLLLGFLAGVVAKILMPGKDPGGLIITTVLGVAGSTVATFIGHHYGWFEAGQLPGFVVAVAGAFIILAVYRLVKIIV
jgi:uncharacterized membrane protein YeaQ/YmgE (transglycosylase-associated protein family)